MTSTAKDQDHAPLWESPEAAPESPSARSAGRPMETPRRPTAPTEFSELWAIDEVANYLGVPKQTIYCWRTSGYGPQGFRVGKHLRWRTATVIAWTLKMERQQ